MSTAADQTEALNDLLTEWGEPVTIARGNDSDEVDAFPAVKTDTPIHPDDYSISARRRYWFVPTASYTPAGSPVEPAPGDTITTAAGTVYEVQIDPGTERPFFYPDDGRTFLKIHTIEL